MQQIDTTRKIKHVVSSSRTIFVEYRVGFITTPPWITNAQKVACEHVIWQICVIRYLLFVRTNGYSSHHNHVYLRDPRILEIHNAWFEIATIQRAMCGWGANSYKLAFHSTKYALRHELGPKESRLLLTEPRISNSTSLHLSFQTYASMYKWSYSISTGLCVTKSVSASLKLNSAYYI